MHLQSLVYSKFPLFSPVDGVDGENKAELLLQKGRAWNVLPDFSPEALECLSRAVKLDPKMVEAWNNLGETYWKKKDVSAAKNCFEGALNYVSILSILIIFF